MKSTEQERNGKPIFKTFFRRDLEVQWLQDVENFEPRKIEIMENHNFKDYKNPDAEFGCRRDREHPSDINYDFEFNVTMFNCHGISAVSHSIKSFHSYNNSRWYTLHNTS